jgi:hypothetical protein
MKPVFTTGYKSKHISRMWTHVFKNNENKEAIIDKPATVTLLSENGFIFLQALNFQNPSKLQQALFLYDG